MRETQKNSRAASGTPAYMRVCKALRTSIVKGEYPLGVFLPSEQKIADMFASNKCTVRQALTMLAEDGMVSAFFTVPCTCKMLFIGMLDSINRYKYLLNRFFSVKKMI